MDSRAGVQLVWGRYLESMETHGNILLKTIKSMANINVRALNLFPVVG